jgi:acyl dehydratase
MQETLSIDDLRVGLSLPELDLPITSSIVVGGALASRDFTPVHHDKKAAIEQGLPDIFLNILTTQGICSRYVTDWAGPNAIVKRVRTKLGGPAMPGDTLKIRGRVVAMDGNTVDIEVAGNNAWGNHVTATLTIQLP